MKRLLRILWWIWGYWDKSDPVFHCEVYKDKGCAHVDGMLCNMQTCQELHDYRKELKEQK